MHHRACEAFSSVSTLFYKPGAGDLAGKRIRQAPTLLGPGTEPGCSLCRVVLQLWATASLSLLESDMGRRLTKHVVLCFGGGGWEATFINDGEGRGSLCRVYAICRREESPVLPSFASCGIE